MRPPPKTRAAGAFDPVTEADREAERAIRELIDPSAFPSMESRGEEWPDRPGAGHSAWSLDPVDGTRSFICRLPTWVTLIALLEEGRPVLGLIDAPCLDEIYRRLRRRGMDDLEGRAHALRRPAAARVSPMPGLSTTDPFLFDCARSAAFETTPAGRSNHALRA